MRQRPADWLRTTQGACRSCGLTQGEAERGLRAHALLIIGLVQKKTGPGMRVDVSGGISLRAEIRGRRRPVSYGCVRIDGVELHAQVGEFMPVPRRASRPKQYASAGKSPASASRASPNPLAPCTAGIHSALRIRPTGGLYHCSIRRRAFRTTHAGDTPHLHATFWSAPRNCGGTGDLPRASALFERPARSPSTSAASASVAQ